MEDVVKQEVTTKGTPHRWKKGECGNPKGRPKNAEPDLLRQALAKEGVKRGIDFWSKVAEVAFRDRTVMVAVLKKFVPDCSEIRMEGNAERTIVVVNHNRPGNQSDGHSNRTSVLSTHQPAEDTR